jgi:hypothetical protein
MSAPVTLKQGKIRRPAVARLATLLQRENPGWSEDECITRAKAQVTSTHIRVIGIDGIVREVKRGAA